jgi:amino acid permease
MDSEKYADNGNQDYESPPAEGNEEFNLAVKGQQLERGLKSRHIQFLALGKCY